MNIAFQILMCYNKGYGKRAIEQLLQVIPLFKNLLNRHAPSPTPTPIHTHAMEQNCLINLDSLNFIKGLDHILIFKK